MSFVILWQISCGASINPYLKYTCDLSFLHSNVGNQNTARIPFQLLGRLITVQARINGIEGTFIFDTGASGLLLNKRYTSTLVKSIDKNAYSSLGSTPHLGQTSLDSFYLRQLVFNDILADIVDISSIEDKRKEKITGLIGYSIFKDFEVFIDYPFRQIILTRVDKKGRRLDPFGISELPADSMDFKLFKHAIVMEGKVNGETLKFTLDTGAEFNLLDSRVSNSVLHNFNIIRRITMIGIGDKEVEAMAGKLYGLSCGPGPTYTMRTLLARTDYIRHATNVRVDGVLGYEYLYLKRISINYKKKKIYFYDYDDLKP